MIIEQNDICTLCYGSKRINTYKSNRSGHNIWDDCECVLKFTEEEIFEKKVIEFLNKKNKAFILNNLS